MPFSDDGFTGVEPNPFLRTIVLIVSFLLFSLSLFNFCFCTENGCRTSFEALLLGWAAVITGGTGLSWLATPLLITSWVLLTNDKRNAWIFAMLALMLSLSFLLFNTVLENEAGSFNRVTQIKIGYWLWVSSCLTAFAGSLLLKFLKRNPYTGSV